MNVGLQIWNGSGQLMLDATSRIGRIKTMISLSGGSGSMGVDLSGGEPFWSFQPAFLFAHISNISPVPVVTLSATTVTWTYSAAPKSNYIFPISGFLLVGIF